MRRNYSEHEYTDKETKHIKEIKKSYGTWRKGQEGPRLSTRSSGRGGADNGERRSVRWSWACLRIDRSHSSSHPKIALGPKWDKYGKFTVYTL